MSERSYSVNPIDERAIEWVARLDKGDLAAGMQAELDAWLAEDARHKGAFLRARATWTSLDKLQILPIEIGRSKWPSLFSRRGVLAGGGAAAIAAASASFVAVWMNRDQIQTPIGEIRRVPLSDGSVVAVNTNSELNIDLKPDMREVTIDKGEVWFDVAKDRARPFVVAAGDVRVRAVGTAFSVRLRTGGADVLVTEGVVEAWTTNAMDAKRRISAGSKVFVSDVAGPSRIVEAPKQIDRALAWRNGEIALDGESLGEAVAEFNRYNSRQVTIDPALADKRFVGWFHANDPDTFAQAAAAALHAKVISRRDEIHIAQDSAP